MYRVSKHKTKRVHTNTMVARVGSVNPNVYQKEDRIDGLHLYIPICPSHSRRFPFKKDVCASTFYHSRTSHIGCMCLFITKITFRIVSIIRNLHTAILAYSKRNTC